jgi:hypothetical protein
MASDNFEQKVFEELRGEARKLVKEGIEKRGKAQLGTTAGPDKYTYKQEAEEAFEQARAIAIVASLYKP